MSPFPHLPVSLPLSLYLFYPHLSVSFSSSLAQMSLFAYNHFGNDPEQNIISMFWELICKWIYALRGPLVRKVGPCCMYC